MKHNRLDELADGIFAIVMTLLVFEIKVPSLPAFTSNMTLWTELLHLVPAFGGFVLSFLLLFTYWKAQHFFTSVYAKNLDSRLMNINIIFFLLITIIPFSSSMLGKYPENELAITLFGLHIILLGLTVYWMRNYVFFSEHIKNPEISQREIHGSTLRTLFPVVSALIAIPLAFINPALSITLFTVAVVFNLSSYSTKIFDKFIK